MKDKDFFPKNIFQILNLLKNIFFNKSQALKMFYLEHDYVISCVWYLGTFLKSRKRLCDCQILRFFFPTKVRK